MALIGATALTALDWARRLDDDKKVATIVELLSQTNEIMQDMLWVEATGVDSHKTTVRTGLPTSTWRLLNYGVQPSKSTTAQIVDTIGNLEAHSEIDVDLAKLNGNTAEFRLSENQAFLESMSQTMASTLFYGSARQNPERFTGLAPRYYTVNEATAASAANVLDAGGVGSDNTSIWVVVWGSQTAHGIFPKSYPTGLTHMDKGEWMVSDPNGGKYFAYVDHYKWSMGLTVRDWRYVVRIANIDSSDLNTVSAANLINLLVRAVNRLPTQPAMVGPVQTSDAPSISGPMGRAVIYCNRTVREFLDLQAMNKTNVLLQLDQAYGTVVTKFRGIPIRTCDAILGTETRLT